MRATLVVLLALTLSGAAHAQAPDPFASAAEQQAAMAAGRLTSEKLVRLYLDRIKKLDRAGPRLNSVLALNPHALAEARARDKERRAGRLRGPLHGIPILLKDNIESADGTATTAGSLALAANITGRDAPLVRRLTDAGAVILGKANLSEWANFRSTASISGWSAVGGLVRNPHSLDRSACGSSAGSGAAVAAGLVTAAIGTETNGSIVCPAAFNGVVGLKPTVGLVSRTYLVPISPAQDTAGPMTRTVADAAAVLAALAGSDPLDPATKDADARKSDYLAALSKEALRGRRIAVWTPYPGVSVPADKVFAKALEVLRAQGAVLVEVKGPDTAALGKITGAQFGLLSTDFKAAINAYLATTAPGVATRDLDQLIAFNAKAPRETALFGQEIFEAAAKAPPITDAAHQAKRAETGKLASEALDAILAEAKAVAIVAPSGAPAFLVDPLGRPSSLGSPAGLPAISGYPHLTLPMGEVMGLPVGISFIGPAWSEATLLSLGHAFEQAAPARREPAFLPNIGARAETAAAIDPK
jgi:amidase